MMHMMYEAFFATLYSLFFVNGFSFRIFEWMRSNIAYFIYFSGVIVQALTRVTFHQEGLCFWPN